MLSRADVETIINQWRSDGVFAELPSLDQYEALPFAHRRYWAPFIVIGRP